MDMLKKYVDELTRPDNYAALQLSFWASMGTFVGGITIVFLVIALGADPRSKKTSTMMGILQSLSGGVMIFMTCFHLIPESVESIGSFETMAYFFIGVIVFGILEKLIIPHEHVEANVSQMQNGELEKERSPRNTAQESIDLYRTSLITFIAMALHNIPEGISVYLAALSNPKMVLLVEKGMQLAFAIMLHNIPEGMAVAIPIYASTGSIAKVLWWTLLNGLAEPAGVLFGGLLLAPYLDQFILSRCLAFVAGIMFCISTHELYPVSIRYCGKDLASLSLMIGMFFCWIALESIDYFFESGHGHDHSSSHYGHDTTAGHIHNHKHSH